MCNNDRKTNKLVAHHQYNYLKFKISQTFFIFEGKLIFFLGEYLPTLTVKSQNGRVTVQVTYIYLQNKFNFFTFNRKISTFNDKKSIKVMTKTFLFNN